MLQGKKIIVVLPAYNAEKTFQRTYDEIPKDIVDEIILVDDHSRDHTAEVARKAGVSVITHERNLGYGGNQKTCYKEALKRGADIIIMLHPDYQYPPKLVAPMAALIASGMFDVVLGSRILGGYALKGGMPFYKYISNRLLTAFENLMTGQKLSEYHTGYRAFSREVLINLPILENSDDFIFDNQILTQVFCFGYRIGEITSPCSYNQDCSSISFRRSVQYGFGVLNSSMRYWLQKRGLRHYRLFDKQNGAKLVVSL
ncbi:MAG TPA: glycosyltransferase family 2 protein [Candidatus Omnitrophota bacterium]|nr:glycosyltransferase family 2 protein [Candidatus Omnitrophota bacterium]HPD84066.1 glycosyltransferase family 2 protein [Candidatus Omnitrophota bacterium]HRZ02923.1 glycosyltransferase family 2 protein [Candidatus Omnitrophota bacterium]